MRSLLCCLRLMRYSTPQAISQDSPGLAQMNFLNSYSCSDSISDDNELASSWSLIAILCRLQCRQTQSLTSDVMRTAVQLCKSLKGVESNLGGSWRHTWNQRTATACMATQGSAATAHALTGCIVYVSEGRKEEVIQELEVSTIGTARHLPLLNTRLLTASQLRIDHHQYLCCDGFVGCSRIV